MRGRKSNRLLEKSEAEKRSRADTSWREGEPGGKLKVMEPEKEEEREEIKRVKRVRLDTSLREGEPSQKLRVVEPEENRKGILKTSKEPETQSLTPPTRQKKNYGSRPYQL